MTLMKASARTKLRMQLIRDEEMRLRLYKCPAGKWTIGAGRNLTDGGITSSEAIYLLENDIDTAFLNTSSVFTEEVMATWSEPRLCAILNMMFNLGLVKFKGFKTMIACIKAGNWPGAADAAMDSKWAKQVGARATRIEKMLRDG